MPEHRGQVERLRAALFPVIAIGPDFLAGRRDADDMAHTMVAAAEAFAKGERANESAPDSIRNPVTASDREAALELRAVFSELYGCGSGYLAARCDSDCVARTMAQILSEFSDLASAPD